MEWLQTVLEFINGEDFKSYLAAITGTITAATAITAVTPTKSDDKIINGVLYVLNIIAGNVLKNKNADAIEKK